MIWSTTGHGALSHLEINMPFHYKATHSSGFVHLRKSVSRVSYVCAVVGQRSGDISCNSTMDNIHKRMEELCRYGNTAKWEVVSLVEIDAAEHAAILKAGVRKHKVVFMGKPYTSTTKLEREPWTHAVGYFRPEMALVSKLGPKANAKWHEQHPDGIYSRVEREQRGVWWFSSEAAAQECIERHTKQDAEEMAREDSYGLLVDTTGRISMGYFLLAAS